MWIVHAIVILFSKFQPNLAQDYLPERPCVSSSTSTICCIYDTSSLQFLHGITGSRCSNCLPHFTSAEIILVTRSLSIYTEGIQLRDTPMSTLRGGERKHHRGKCAHRKPLTRQLRVRCMNMNEFRGPMNERECHYSKIAAERPDIDLNLEYSEYITSLDK